MRRGFLAGYYVLFVIAISVSFFAIRAGDSFPLANLLFLSLAMAFLALMKASLLRGESLTPLLLVTFSLSMASLRTGGPLSFFFPLLLAAGFLFPLETGMKASIGATGAFALLALLYHVPQGEAWKEIIVEVVSLAFVSLGLGGFSVRLREKKEMAETEREAIRCVVDGLREGKGVLGKEALAIRGMEAALSLLRERCGASSSAFYRLEGKGGGLVLTASAGEEKEALLSMVPVGGVFAAALKGVPVSGGGGHSHLLPHRKKGNALPFICFPVEKDGKAIGVISIEREDDGKPFGAGEMEAVREASVMIGTVIHGQEAANFLERKVEENEAFFRASRKLIEAKRMEEIGEVILSEVAGFVRAEIGVLVLPGDKGRPCVFRTFGMKREICGLPLDTSGEKGGLMGQILAMEKDFYRQRIEENAIFSFLGPAFPPEEGIKAIMAFLFRKGDGKGIGGLLLATRERDEMEEEERDRVSVIAGIAGAAVEKAMRIEEEAQKAITDELTGLFNHRFLLEKIPEKAHHASMRRKPLTLVMLDVDHFKQVNDTYGHPVGDRVLKRIAGILRGMVRAEGDMVARYGGEEMALLMEETEAKAARNLAERIRKRVEEETFWVRQGERPDRFSVTVSFGIASLMDDAEGAMELVEKADRALYHAKNTGRNRVCLFSEIP